MTVNWFWPKHVGFIVLKYKCCVDWL